MPEEKVIQLSEKLAVLVQRFTDEGKRSTEQHEKIDTSLIKIDATLSDIFVEVKKTNGRVNKMETEREVQNAKIQTAIAMMKFFAALGFGGVSFSILPILFDIFGK